MKSLYSLFSLALVLFVLAPPAHAQTAQVTGDWDVTITSPLGSNTNKVAFKQDAGKTAGAFKSQQGELPLKNVTLTGQDIQIAFDYKRDGMEMVITLKGKVDGDSMKGEADFGGMAQGEWSAKRAAAGAAPASAPAASGGHNITGEWAGQVETAQGSGSPAFTFKQEGEKLTGQYKGMLGEAPVNGTVKGADVDFVIETSQGKVVYKGKIEGAEMKGTVSLGDIGSGTWTAKRK
ncbi:MAG: hypothetical protein ACKV2V_21610 [Blastocatellia bacterium]